MTKSINVLDGSRNSIVIANITGKYAVMYHLATAFYVTSLDY